MSGKLDDLWEAVLLVDGVAPAQDHRVRLPAFANLCPDLPFDGCKPCLVHAAEPSRLVLDAKQNEIPVADSLLTPLCVRGFF